MVQGAMAFHVNTIHRQPNRPGLWFSQKRHFGCVAVEIDGAVPTIFQSGMAGSLFYDFVTWGAGSFIGRARFFLAAVKDDPARCRRQEKLQAGQCESMLVNQFLDAENLLDI